MISNNSTKFFYELTPERILAAVEKLGDRCTGRIVPLNSIENRVYDVEIEKSEAEIKTRYDLSRVIKFYRPGRWTREQILEEHQFIIDLQEDGLPVVPPLEFKDGSTLHRVPDLEDDFFYAIFPKVGGRILDEYSDKQIRSLGRLIARLHLSARTKVSKHRATLNTQTFGIDNCNYLIEQGILPAEIQSRYQSLVGQICETAKPWFDSVPVQRLHGDCHLGNILWHDQGCTFVDFDDFLMGPAIQDLWLIMPGRDTWNMKQREILIKAYSELVSFDQESIRLIEPLRALRMINFSTWIAKRWEDPAFKNIFTIFGTPQYWREDLNALEEVWQIMQCGEIF